MDYKTDVLIKILAPAALVAILSCGASAELIKGTVKSIAAESQAFTLQTTQDSVLLILWDNKTAWLGIKKPAEIHPDEAVTVDFSLLGDQTVAVAVSRVTSYIPAGVKAMQLDKLPESPQGLDKARPAVFVDTRPSELFDAAHIPGAISVPLARLEKRTFGLLPEDKTVKLIFYDEGQGGAAASKGAEIAVRGGFTDVSILPEGAADWVNSGRFLASSPAFIRKARPVIIDLRKAEAVSQGHIEGAVNFPLSGLKDRYGYFPIGKRTPIVLYGESDSEAVAAVKQIRAWGYRNVTIFPGGSAAWLNSAEVLATGPGEEHINYRSASHGGHLTPADFEKALSSPQMVEIVDARSAVEQKKGGFPQSKKIPLHDMPKRHGELDREMIQVVFAADAPQAEMAYDFLKSKGYRVNYLHGVVEFGKDGKHTVK